MAVAPLDTWIVHRVPAENPRVRLICFPYAGGSAAVFRPWQRMLPRQVEVCPIEYPGRASRFAEPPMESVVALSEAVAHALQPLFLEPPVALFGHSLGALVAFEVARALRREGTQPPCHLFVAAQRAPQPSFLAPQSVLPAGELSGGSPLLLDRLRSYGGVSPELLANEELMDLMLPVLRADFQAAESYVLHQEEPLDVPITAFGGADDHRITKADIDAWRVHTRADFRSEMLPGDHFFPQSSTPDLLATISASLS